MTVLDKLHSMSSSELAEFLDTYFSTDENPPIKYFNNKFCVKCLDSLPDPYATAAQDADTYSNFIYPEAPCEHTNHCPRCETYEVLQGSNMTRLWLESDEENLYG